MEEYIYKLNSGFKTALIDFFINPPKQNINNFLLNIKRDLDVYLGFANFLSKP